MQCLWVFQTWNFFFDFWSWNTFGAKMFAWWFFSRMIFNFFVNFENLIFNKLIDTHWQMFVLGYSQTKCNIGKEIVKTIFLIAQSHIKRSNNYLRKGVSQFSKSIYCQLHSFVSWLITVFFFHFFNKIHKNFVLLWAN